jgi:hypothetical protein
MINLHTELLDELKGDELAIFCQIIRHIDNDKKCFPSRARLSKLTGYGREKIKKVIASLIDKKIISTKQSKEEGKFSKTIYTILTDKAGVYVSTKNKELHRATGLRSTETPHTENQPLSIIQDISIIQDNNKSDYELKLEGYIKGLQKETDYIKGMYALHKLKDKRLGQLVNHFKNFCLTLPDQSKPKDLNHFRNFFTKWVKQQFDEGKYSHYTTKRLKGSL